jgi:hypothetical protein
MHLQHKLNTLRKKYGAAIGELPDDIEKMTKAQVIEHANTLAAAAIAMKLGQAAANKKAKRWQGHQRPRHRGGRASAALPQDEGAG